MAIIQISKIQQRTGNLVDLPQLDDGEFGWATDAKRLYIGKSTPNENIEVLTTYSNISFSQLDGAVGNLNISSPTNGQILTYVASTNTWENYANGSTQLSGGKLQLGYVSNISILGGAISYVLSTDGTGNLSWTPKGTLIANIEAMSNANPIIMTLPHSGGNVIPLVNGSQVTITGVAGANANTIVNGQSFYLTLATDYNTSGNVKLYTDSGRTAGANGFYLTATANTGVATSVISGGGSGSSAGGANTSVQFNDQNISNGVVGFTFDKTTTTLTVSGPINASSIGATSSVTSAILVSNIATGTAPLTVTSTTRVANLDVAKAGVANTVNDAAQSNITSVGTLTSLNSSGNITAPIVIANASGTGNNFKVGDDAWIGEINVNNTLVIKGQQDGANGYIIFGNGDTTSTLGRAGTGALTYAGAFSATGNANVANLGTTGVFATTLSSTGNANVGNLGSAGLITATGNINGGNIISGGVLSATGNANVGNLGTGGLITATGNITGGNLITGGAISATGNANVGNLGVTGVFAGTLSATGNANVGNIGATLFVGTLETAAQPNVTSLGTLTSLSVSGNANIGNIGTGGLVTATGNVTGGNLVTAGVVSASGNATVLGIKTDNYYYANGVSISFAGSYSNSNVSSYLPTYTGQVGTGAATFQGANITTGANTTAGNITGDWTLTTGSKLQATYADLAEYYEADQDYEPGTVIEFGGEKEVTIASDGTTRVAGVVSTNPAYAMNAKCPGIAVALALQGRVPTKVRGTIRKGDLMISGGNGFARPSTSPQMGTVIGKALENFDGIEGVIEIAVGRL